MSNINMLPVQFTVMSLSGIWCPLNWSSNWMKRLYQLYSFLINLLMYTLGLSQLARLIFIKQNFTEFNNTFFILLSTNFTCFKAACNILIRPRVINLIKLFEHNCCIAHGLIEINIKKKYDNTCRILSLGLLILVEVTALCMIAAPFNNGTANQELIYKVFLPYDLSHPLFYWLTFIHQSFGAIFYAAISITNDALIAGFMLQVCGQLQLLTHRIKKYSYCIINAIEKKQSKEIIRLLERRFIANNVQHHTHIFRIADSICKTFYEVIVCQFFVSALAISVSVYQISVGTTNRVALLTYILYLICMLQQFFVYCYFGNEVSVQSKHISTIIFGIDWSSLSLELIRDLTIIILRSTKPIHMSCGAFIHMTLESFANIVKMSYSVFNVLKQSI